MDIFPMVLIYFMPFIVILLWHLAQRRPCPDCGETLPSFQSPFTKTRRQWAWGGYLCTRCGCETNMSGQKVNADTPAQPLPVIQWTVLITLLLLGIGLGVFTLMTGPGVVNPPLRDGIP